MSYGHIVHVLNKQLGLGLSELILWYFQLQRLMTHLQSKQEERFFR